MAYSKKKTTCYCNGEIVFSSCKFGVKKHNPFRKIAIFKNQQYDCA